MRSITKQLDMSPGAVSPVVHVSQYDSDFTIVFNLYCTDGTFTLESGTTAEVRGTKKSGTGYSASATVNVSAKTVTVAGHKQMTAVAGDNVYEITLYKGSKELNSINFILAVERAAMDQDTVTDETVIREFGELETYIEGVKADTATSASAAQASQTAAAQSATNAANSAIEAAQSAQSVDAERLNRIAFGSYVVEESTGPIAHFEDGADNIPMKDVLVHIEPVQAGSGDPSPDNVRPITGWTGAKVTRTGKNLLPIHDPIFISNPGTITATPVYDANGNVEYVTINGTSNSSRETLVQFSARLSADALKLIPESYVLSIGGAPKYGANIQVGRNSTPTGGSYVLIARTTNTSLNFAIDYHYGLTVQIVIPANTTIDNWVVYPMIRLASDTDSTYEPYSGSTYSVTFPSSAGIVYGGTLDVTSGILTVDKVSIDMGERSIVTFSNGFSFATPSAIRKAAGKTGILCDCYKPVTKGTAVIVDYEITGGNADASLYFKDSRFTTPEEAKAGLSGHYVCYPLEAPQTYQLTPQEITSLLGENNVWADTGDSDVEYRADTALYIGRLTEPDADMIADSNITSGQYFMVGNSLYRATSNIASGASVVVGTNAVKVSLATALNEINQ